MALRRDGRRDFRYPAAARRSSSASGHRRARISQQPRLCSLCPVTPQKALPPPRRSVQPAGTSQWLGEAVCSLVLGTATLRLRARAFEQAWPGKSALLDVTTSIKRVPVSSHQQLALTGTSTPCPHQGCPRALFVGHCSFAPIPNLSLTLGSKLQCLMYHHGWASWAGWPVHLGTVQARLQRELGSQRWGGG